MTSLEVHLETIARKRQQLEAQRQKENAAFEELMKKAATVEDVASLREDLNAMTTVTKLCINGVEVSKGDRVLVKDSAEILKGADSVLPATARDRTKVIYLGMRGTVTEIVESYCGKRGLELQFTDGVKKMFFEECLAVGNANSSTATSATAGVAIRDGKENDSGQNALVRREQNSSVLNQAQRPKPAAQPAVAQRAAAATPPPSMPMKKPAPRAIVLHDDSPDSGSSSARQSPAAVPVAHEEADAVPVSAKRLSYDSRASSPRDNESDNCAFPPQDTRNVEPAQISEQKNVSGIPCCPADYVPIYELGDPASRIPRIITRVSTQQALSATPKAAGPIGCNSISAPPSPSCSSGCGVAQHIQLRAHTPVLRKKQPAEQTSPRPLLTTGGPRPTQAPPVLCETQGRSGTAPPKEVPAAAKPAVRQCLLYVNGRYNPDDPSCSKSITIRDTHSTMASLYSLCTRELGWGVIGRRVERLFTAAGREVLSPEMVVAGVALVATTGDVFCAPVSYPKPRGGASIRNARTPSPHARASSPCAAVRTKTPLARARSPSPCVARPVTLRVYMNGVYGDEVNDRVPYRTVTVRPTSTGSLAAIYSTVTRELSWHSLGRRVEALYSADGKEIRDAAELADGSNIVASAGDAFIAPRPHSMLFSVENGGAGAAPTQPVVRRPPAVLAKASSSASTTKEIKRARSPCAAGKRVAASDAARLQEEIRQLEAKLRGEA